MAARGPWRITRRRAPRPAVRGAALLAASAALLCGCGASSRGLSIATDTHQAVATTNPAAPGAMGQMSGGSTGASSASGSGTSVDGITPIPSQTLGTADWQHMRIMAQARTAVPFVIYDGTSEKLIKPTRHTSFHLMVMLTDDRTDYPIPYASVWATIRRGPRIVFDERQWPMLSEYMGPHYGNNVALPGPGSYRLSLLVSPPVAARHIEYQNVWLKPHRVSFTFRWDPRS